MSDGGTQPDQQPIWRDWGVWLVGALVVWGAAYCAWVFVGAGGERQRTVVSDVAILPVGFFAGVLAWRAARGLPSRGGGRAWTLIAVAFFSWWAGDAIWFWYEVVNHSQPFPSAADAGYLAFYPLMLAGLLAVPVGRRTRAEQRKLVLDATTVMLAGAMVVWYLVVAPTVRGKAAPVLNQALSLAYPVGDLLLIFGAAIVLLRRPEPGNRAAIRLVVVAIACFVVADVGYAHLSLAGTYHGGDWPDAAWMAALVLFAVGAQSRTSLSGRQPDDAAAETPAAVSKLPYLAVAVGYALLFGVGRHAGSPLNGLLVGSVALTALVAVRQISAQNENYRLTVALQRLAVTDSLTGVLNRRSLFELAQRECDRARRSGGPIAAIIVDLDHFKAVNDTYGHRVGDAALCAVATACVEELRAVDVFGRYGGDEFLAVLPDTPLDAANAVAERLCRRVEALAIDTPAGPLAPTASFGVAAQYHAPAIGALVELADTALYRAKRAGRSRVETVAVGPEEPRVPSA